MTPTIPLPDPWIALTSLKTGLIDVKMQLDYWSAPQHVEVRDDYLLYSEKDIHPVRAQPGMLEAFANLAKACPEAVVAYAKRWGVLNVCKHGIVQTQRRPSINHSGYSLPQECPYNQHCSRRVVRVKGQPYFAEPLQLWNDASERVSEILRLGGAFAAGKIRETRDADSILTPKASGHPSALLARCPVDAMLTGDLHLLVLMSGLAPEVRWEGHLIFNVAARNMLQAVVFQTILSISRTDGFAICSACSKPFIPSRRPQKGRNSYCPDCGSRAAWRVAQRKRRERMLKAGGGKSS